MTAHTWPPRLPQYVKPPEALNSRRWHPTLCCSICGERIRRHQEFNHDHIRPISQGGRRGKVNKAYAHVICNSVKGDRYPFSLRTAEDRAAVHEWVTPRTWQYLNRVWTGTD